MHFPHGLPCSHRRRLPLNQTSLRYLETREVLEAWLLNLLVPGCGNHFLDYFPRLEGADYPVPLDLLDAEATSVVDRYCFVGYTWRSHTR